MLGRMSEMSKPERRANFWATLWLLLGALAMTLVGLMAFISDEFLLGAGAVLISLVCIWAGVFAPPKVRQALAGLLP